MKRIFTYILLFLLLGGLVSCSDDVFEGPMREVPADGHLTLRYVIPEMETTHTRGLKDSDIDNLYLLIFNSAGNLVQVEDVSSMVSGASGTFEITLKSGIRKDGNLSFLLAANTPKDMDLAYFEGDGERPGLMGSEKNTITSIPTRLLQMPSHESGNEDTYLGMSGSATLSDILAFNAIPLYRSAAKVSVNMGKKNGSVLATEEIDGNTYYQRDEALPFNAYGTAVESSIFAGADHNNPKLGQSPSTVSVSESATVTDSSEKFIHATKNSSTGRAFVIVKAKFDNTDYYYRLDYLDGSGTPMDIKPNHWYQFVIKEVKGAGFATPREASNNPTSQNAGNIDWNVYDYVPRVMNSITDGINYLSVSDEVTHVGNLTGTNTATEECYVYILNRNNEYPTPKFSAANCSSDKAWLSVIAAEEITDENWTSVPLDEHNGPADNPGVLYKITLQISNPSNTPPGSQTGKITVRWNGLTRAIPVFWDRSFDPSDIISSAMMQVYNGSAEETTWKQTDYFKFLAGSNTEAPQVWGVEAEANNGYDRNDGFHFPVLYGDNASNPWTYKYTVRFKNQTDNVYKWRFTMQTAEGTPDITVVKDNTTITVKEDTGNYDISTDSEGNKVMTCKLNNANGPLVELTFNSAAAGSIYGTGVLLVEVAPQGTNDWTEIPLNVYHTGFFHKDNSSHAIAGSMSNARPYTYYEVVEMAGYCWLDRNLGAHSSELYIERSNGQPQYGTTEGRGGYYYIAKQVNKAPQFYDGICPPGYQIPYSTDWNSVKLSSAFWTTDLGSYNTAYFVSGARYEDGTYKNVYFPKARFYDAATKAGDSLTGYYWSQTTATGFEKDEIGRWLRGFVIFGETSYYNNSRIDYNNISHNGYAMNIRAVRKHTESVNNHNYSFFVRGATHVYAYIENETGRVPVTTWPGTPIANYSSADMEYMNYSYSGAAAPEELKLIFNYKAANGSVVSVSKGGGHTAVITRDVSPSALAGWKASGDLAPNVGMTVSGGSPAVTALATTAVKTPSTDDNYYWIINRNDAQKVYFTNTEVSFAAPGVTYQIHGTMFNGEWDTSGSKVALTKESSSNVWKAHITTTRAGKFVIQALRNGEEYTAYKREGGDGNVTLGTPMQTSTSGGNYSLPAGEYTFSFNADTKELTVYSGSGPSYTYQIHGDIFNGSWDNTGNNYGNNPGSKKALTNVDTDIWEGTFVLPYDGKEFIIQKMEGTEQASVFKQSGSGNFTIGSTLTLTENSGNNLGIEKKGKYKFSFNSSNKQLKVTEILKYVIKGNIWENAGDWYYNTDVEEDANGNWCYKNVVLKAGDFGIGAFAYNETSFGDDGDNNTRRGWYTASVSSDATIDIGNSVGSNKSVSIKKDGSNMSLTKGGTYDLIFNPNTNILTITRKVAYSEPTDPYKYAIHGNIWDGSNWSPKAMTNNNGIWVLENEWCKGGSFGIRPYTNDINSENMWFWSTNGTVNFGSSLTVKDKDTYTSGTNWTGLPTGTYTFKFNRNNMTLDVIPQLYLVGDVTGWGKNDAYRMSTTDGKTYTLTVTNLSDEFKFYGGAWGVYEFGGAGTNLSNGTYTNLSGGGGNMKLSSVRTVKFTITQTNNFANLTFKIE